jgi:hypothetical protein
VTTTATALTKTSIRGARASASLKQQQYNLSLQNVNYPFQRIFQNKPPYGKDRQRYVLNLTVLWFRLACVSKKTVRNTVNLYSYR